MEKKELTEDQLELIKKVSEKLLCSDITTTKAADKFDNSIPEDTSPGNWYFHYTTEEEEAKNPYDKEFELKGTPRYDFDISKLSAENIETLKEHNMLDENGQMHAELEYYMRGDINLHIKTPRSTWLSLCGRHWVFNLQDNTINLICMS